MDRKRASAPDIRPAAAANAPTNKDPFTYAAERERFLKDLRQFHDGRGTSIPRLPYIAGKSVDLYALYTSVTKLGGWEKVSNDETWPDIQEQFGIPVTCGNADHALRQIYIRYLHAYEKLHHFGQDPDSREDTTDLDDLPSSRKKTVGPVGGVALTYNYQQHNLHESTREMLGLPKEVGRASEYANLERSLMSGLPNEIDFAVNICLLLSTEGKHTLKGSRGLRIVELLLSHVGICKESELALIWLISESKLNFLRFWNDSVDDQSVKELVCPECLLIDKVEEYRLENGMVDDDDVDMSSVLHLGRGCGMEDHEAQRVIQLAVITRNLSFEEENLEPFASSLVVLRFIMLCAYNKHGCIRQLALDTMANVAIKMNLEPVDCGMTLLVLKTVSSCLLSWDKFQVVSALETLSRLCQMELNEEAICCQLDDAVYEHLIRLLTIQDLQLIVSALETIYQLSEIGTLTSNRIAQVSASVDVLVALLTLEADAYGPSALLGIPAVENTVEISNPVQGQTMGPPPARLPTIVPRPPAAAVPCVIAPNLSIAQMTPSFLTPRVPLPASTAPSSIAPSPLPATVRSGPGIADSEATASNWLQAQYELSSGCSVKKMDMYRKYVSTFGKYGLQNLVSPTCFANCIRVAFPGVEQESTDKDGTNEVAYKGLTSRQKPGPFSPAAGDIASGQQLQTVVTCDNTGLPKTIHVLPLAASTQAGFSITSNSQFVAAFPAIQQVLLSSQGRSDPSSDGPSASSVPPATGGREPNFVKTLLASKVTQHMNRVQSQCVVDTLDSAVVQPSPQHNGTTILNSLSGVTVSGDVSVVPCSDDTKLPTGDSRTTADISAAATQSSVSVASGALMANKSVLSEHSYIQTVELFQDKFRASDSGKSITFVDDGKLNELVDGWANSDDDSSRGFDSVAQMVSDGPSGFEQNIGAGGELNSLELACDSASSFQEFSEAGMPLPAVVNGSLSSVCKDAENARSNSIVEGTNGKECGMFLNGVARGIINGECGMEKAHPDGEWSEGGMARKSIGKKDDGAVISDRLAFQKQCTKAANFANRLTLAEDAGDVLAKAEESSAKDVDISSRLVLDDIVSRSENGSVEIDRCYQGPSLGDRFQDPECSYDMSSDELSPFPSTFSNVDGVSDNIPQSEDANCGSLQRIDGENDRKIDPNRLLLAPDPVNLDPPRNDSELDLNTECPFGEGMSATTENSDILLLEDFTVAHEEVLASDAVHDHSEYSLNPSDSQFTITEPPESGPSGGNTAMIGQAGVAATSSVLPLQRPQFFGGSQETTVFQKDVLPSLPISSLPNSSLSNSSLSVPISIPASIQARLASFQLGSFPPGVQSRLPLGTFRPAVSNPSQLSNPPHSVTLFSQTYPTNDTGQSGVQPDHPPAFGGLQTAVQIPTSHTAPSSQFAIGSSSSSSMQQQHPNVDTLPAVTSTLPSGISIVHSTETSNTSQPAQALFNHPHAMPHAAVHPLLPQSSPLFVTPSSSAPANQGTGGARIQFLSSASNPGHPQQLHKFVSTTTPGHIIIQRAQLVPQQQQQQQQQSSLRPLQQPIFQRFFVSQSGGGMPQRQIVIQSNPMLLHQGATGQLRPGFVQQSGQASSGTGQQPLGGQMLPPQQRHVIQGGQLTGYRLIQGQGQRPLLVQQTGQPGQILVQQGPPHAGLQDSKAATGQTFAHQGQALDHGQGQGQTGQVINPQSQIVTQQGQGGQVATQQQGQMVTQQGQAGQMITQPGQAGQVIMQQGHMIAHQGQLGQMITPQGQVGHIFTQQGQLLVGQQGQILCHPGQQGGTMANQGTGGPLVIQHSGGQIVLQGTSASGLQNCIMFQQGVKRMVEASKDSAAPASSSLNIPTTAASYRIITASAPLHSATQNAMTNTQQPLQQLQVNTGSQMSLPAVVSPSSPSAPKKRKPTPSHSRSTKKRKKDDEDSVGGDVDCAQGKAQLPVQYVCEWTGCQRSFGSFSSILQHATKEHFEANKESAIMCEWAGCDGLKRQRWSFMTHLQDRHVNEANLKAAATKRLQQVPGAGSPPPSAPPVLSTAVYPPNAALQAIRRFSTRPPFPEMLDAKETPVTKHIHLTSALILRNLARYSSLGRSLIKRHEKHLAYIAFSETESSSAISNCLWELQGL